MKIAVLTCYEPFYLPAFYHRFLARRAKDVVGVFCCTPIYKNQTLFSQARCFAGAFGIWNAVRLVIRVATAKLKGLIGLGRRRGRFYSVTRAVRHHGVHVEYIHDVNTQAFHQRLREFGADLILSVSCPQIFKKELIELPALGCLNIHGADLPNYRGLMPSFWMMADGLKEAGVTIFYVNAGIDTGDVIGKRKFPIFPDDTLHTFLIRAKREACDLAMETLDSIERGTVEPVPLEGEGCYRSYPTRETYQRFRELGYHLW